MMNRSLTPFAIVLQLLIFTTSAYTQDIHFSQFRMAPLVQNPALSGSVENIRTIINYKDQWRSVGTPYKTFNASADMALSKISNKTGYWAGGIQVFHDQAGESEMGSFQANLSAAYHVYISEFSTLGAGLSGGYCQRVINYSSLKWGSQYDGYSYNSSLQAGEPSGSEKIGYGDIGGGLVWNYKRGEKYMTGNDQLHAILGAAIFHPHSPDYSFYKTGENLHMKLVIHGEMLFGVANSNFSVSPGFIFYNQGKSQEVTAGAMFRYTLQDKSKYTSFEQGRAVALGAHFRAKDAFIASFNVELGRLEIGMSYDINISKLESASSGRGGFELGLGYIIANPRRNIEAKK